MTKANLMGTLSNGDEVYELSAPLDKQIQAFSEVGIKSPYLATPEQIAQIRLGNVHTNWSRTSYAPAKVKGKPTIITSDSPYMSEAMARIAAQAHKSGEYPQLPGIFYEALEQSAKEQKNKEPEDRTVHILEGKTNSDGIIKLTSEMDDTRFLLKKFTNEYFERFAHKSIDFHDFFINVPKNKINVNYLWFDNPQYGSGLGASSGDLHNDNSASGVLNKTS